MHISIYIYLPSPPLTRPSILYCYGWVLLSLYPCPPELCSVKFVLSIYFFPLKLQIKHLYSQASEAKADPNKISQYVPLDEEEHKEIDRLFENNI